MSAKIACITAAALFALCGPTASSRAQELVQNGGFETGSFSGWTQFGDTANNGVWQGGPPYPHNGAFLGYFGPASSGGGIRQTLTGIPGDQVHVSLWYVSEGGFTPNSIAVTLGSLQVFSVQNVTSPSWQHFSSDFTLADTNPVLTITFTDPPDWLDMDDVSVVFTGHAGSGCSADFNCDGDVGTDADIEAFFACLAGNCPAPPCNSSADFNGDGDVGTDADIEAFFRVLAGGPC